MALAWYIASGANLLFNCDDCAREKVRNCRGEHGTTFKWQIKQVKTHADRETAFIDECPASYITNFSRALWQKYQDYKFKRELGIKTDDLPAIQFAACKTFMLAEQDYNDHKAKLEEKKHNRGNK